MKRLIWVLVLAFISAGVCVSSLLYVVKTSDEAGKYVSQIKTLTNNGKYENAKIKALELSRFWENNNTMLSIILHHKILEEIEESIKLIATALENTPESESEAKLEITKAEIKINNLRQVEIPTISNII